MAYILIGTSGNSTEVSRGSLRGAGARLAPERVSASRQSGSEPRARAGASLAPERVRGSHQSGCQPPTRAGASLAPERV
ncbi:MAG: hypothetical protein LBD58_06475 [Treponema sp.]|nr:hypothetical protein [Treponema sp.]